MIDIKRTITLETSINTNSGKIYISLEKTPAGRNKLKIDSAAGVINLEFDVLEAITKAARELVEAV